MLIELLGSGGMGRVFRAYDVRVFDSGGDEHGSPYMAMEFAAGGTLKDRIRAQGPLPPREAARLALQAAGAPDAARGAGLVHRDVKPENVLLTEGATSRSRTSGSRAAEATAMTQTSMILGTAPHLSPEQARGEPVGPASDLYSLGVVLYESLTGRPPFGTGEINPLAIAMKHLDEPAPSPREPDNAVPRPLEAVTLALMRERPEDRYPNADALATDLQAFLEGGELSPVAAPPAAPPAGPPPQKTPEPRPSGDPRRPPPAAVGAARWSRSWRPPWPRSSSSSRPRPPSCKDPWPS